MRLTAALALAMLTACGASAGATHTTNAPTDAYVIHLARHVRVGMTWSEVIHLDQVEQTVLRDPHGALVSDTTTRRVIDVAGDYSVFAVDREQPRERVVHHRFTYDDGQGPIEPPLPPVLIIDRSGECSFAGENGEPIDSATTALLRRVYPPHDGTADDDAMFGTSEPRRPGASWPLDPAAVARELGGFDVVVDPSDVRGDTTFVGVASEGGRDVLRVRMVMSAHDLVVPGLPTGTVIERAELLAQMDQVLPADPTLLPLRDEVHFSADIEMQVPTPNGVVTVARGMRQDLTHTRTLP